LTNTTVQRDFGFFYTFGGRYIIKYNIMTYMIHLQWLRIVILCDVPTYYTVYTACSVRVVFFEFIPSHRCFLYECTYSARVCVYAHAYSNKSGRRSLPYANLAQSKHRADTRVQIIFITRREGSVFVIFLPVLN